MFEVSEALSLSCEEYLKIKCSKCGFEEFIRAEVPVWVCPKCFTKFVLFDEEVEEIEVISLRSEVSLNKPWF